SSHSNETVLQAKYRQDEGDSEPTPPAQDSIQLELNSIDEQISDGEMLPAHRALSKLYWNHKDRRDEVIERLEKTSEKIFFQSQPHFIEPYVVQPNDQLRVIASKYNLSWEYLARLNNTEPRRIRSGQKLKVVKGPFAAAIDLADFTLTIHLQGYFVKAYQVGIGQNGSSPLGKFSVLNKVENPQYTGPDGKVISADDPTNPLGERWIDLGDSYGIHGTVDPDSIGKAASRGCIRMRDKDVIEVYNFLIKGSEVVIRE
ncbi:MAG: LysM peptidoglycan-binding domain-containing protein, partial [Planctomycetes bacterium]|nr:LysM peptidoglycan-binding domain-containing protein [Planctomycetota bacterium]